MEQAVRKGRGMNVRDEKLWIHSIQKENELRLAWFRKNEPRLEAMAYSEQSKRVPDEIKDKIKGDTIAAYQGVQKFSKSRKDSINFDILDKHSPLNIMRPVDKDITNLIYTGTQKDGRINYLRERYKVIPEERYYFPETTSFEYGWNMWNTNKNIFASKFARQQVIKESFYRRCNVKGDVDWYKEPAKFYQTTCGCI